MSRKTLSELVNEKRGILPEMAVRLSKVFGGTEEGWLVQRAQYSPCTSAPRSHQP
jgi:plasmid maintenance system antidote protein VapI